METKTPEPEKEFRFIQEKVVPRRKHKVKKMVYAAVFTVVLAVIFGLVARYVFIKSNHFWIKVLGIDTTEREQITFPSEGAENPTGSDGTGENVTITPSISTTPEPTATITGVPDNEDQVTVVEKKIEATVEDYERMLFELKKVATSATSGLAVVTAIENQVDWFDETYETKRTTTGIIIAENNAELLVLTSLDKINGASDLEVTFNSSFSVSGFTVSGKLWSYDKDYNLAVVAVKLKDIPPQKMSSIKIADLGESYSITLGAPVIALGKPDGYNGSMMFGMVSSSGDSYYIMDNRLDVFHTNLNVNNNSDGVIINTKGQIIGIMSEKMKDTANPDVNTVVGISRLKPVIEKLANKTERVTFGIIGEDIPSDVLQSFNLSTGIYVTEVRSDSPAFNAGIKQGDIITQVNEYSVTNISNFASILNNYKPKEIVTVVVQRKVKQELSEKSIKVVLELKE
ncbi:S1C family serine protease [Lachnoclostridium sp.]|uniref:S1C family serine protease n=1 Tax=Lachnoclostridium sp. TaxID=2028282 RepID=UPI0028A1ECAE|nr:S1C family serine protease [Lachnoclostridium sp.]